MLRTPLRKNDAYANKAKAKLRARRTLHELPERDEKRQLAEAEILR